MVTVAATELKDKLSQIIDQARREPVLVQNHGRNIVVILAHAEFKRLSSLERVQHSDHHEEGSGAAAFLLSMAGMFDSGTSDTSERVSEY